MGVVASCSLGLSSSSRSSKMLFRGSWVTCWQVRAWEVVKGLSTGVAVVSQKGMGVGFSRQAYLLAQGPG